MNLSADNPLPLKGFSAGVWLVRRMDYIHIMSILNQFAHNPEAFQKFTKEQKGVDVKFLCYSPEPPWQDSALDGKYFVFRSPRPIGSIYTGEELRKLFGLGIAKIYIEDEFDRRVKAGQKIDEMVAD